MPVQPSPVDLDYVTLDLAPKPFITYTLAANHRSPSVTTDALGFRRQHFTRDGPVELRTLRSEYAGCRVLLGGSTAFGLKASSDQAALATWLSTPETPMINLALPGFGTQQELAALLAMLHLLPEVQDVVILSGVNECVHAVWRPAEVFGEFGGSVAGATRQEPPPPPTGVRKLLGRGRKDVAAQYAEDSIAGASAEEALLPPEEAEHRLALLLDRVANNLRIWALLERAAGFRVHYVLQPVLGWTPKPLTEREAAELENDAAGFPFVRWFVRGEVYQRLLAEIGAAAKAAGIRFQDSNPWLAEERREMFADVCHFRDDGQRLMAGYLRERLGWRDGAA